MNRPMYRTALVTGLRSALALLFWTAGRVAAAATADATEIRLDLQTRDGLTPTHVCIVAEGFDKRLVPSQTQKLSDLELLLCAKGRSCGAPLTWDVSEPLYFSMDRAGAGQTALAAATEQGSMSADSELMRSVRGLSRQSNEHQCVYGPSVGCAPTFSLPFSLRNTSRPRDAYITCTENLAKANGKPVEGAGESRGLVLGISANVAQPLDAVQIRGLRLSGNHLLIRTSHSIENADLVVRTLGGFYTPEPEVRFTRGHADATLALEARCQWTRVGIPPITASKRGPTEEPSDGEEEYELRLELGEERKEREQRERERRRRELHRREHPEVPWTPELPDPPRERTSPDKCLVGSLQGTELQLLIPYEPSGTKILSIHSRERDPNSGEPLWEIETRWLGARPLPGCTRECTEQRLDMSVRSLSFSWRADDCLYPQGECPDARVSTSGLQCTRLNPKLKDGLCRYRCVEDRAYIDFPTEISFSRGDGSTGRPAAAGVGPSAQGSPNASYLKWSLPIRTIGQQLEGYVQPGERAFSIDVSNWRSPSGDEPSLYPCDLYVGLRRRRRCEAQKQEFEAARQKRRETAETAAPEERARIEKELDREELGTLREAICPARPRRDDIFAVEFSTGERERHRIEIDSVLQCDVIGDETKDPEQAPPISAVVKLPRVSCREPIGYRYVGARGYHEATAHVENGAIRLLHPMSLARHLYFSLAIYPASFQWIVSPYELQRRRSALLYAPMIEGSLVVQPRRAAARGWRFNLDVTFMGAQRPYLAVGTTTAAPDPDPQKHLYARWYLGFSFLTPWLGHRQRTHFLGPAAALGAGVQLGLGYPLMNRDVQRFGGIDGGLVALRGDLRIRLWRMIEASLSPRLLLADEAIQYTTDFHGQPDVTRSRKMVSVLLPLGLGFVW